MYEKPIAVQATVVEQRDSKLCYVTLPNGKRILAHRAKGLDLDLLEIAPGAVVHLEMTTFDFEKGRIVAVDHQG